MVSDSIQVFQIYMPNGPFTDILNYHVVIPFCVFQLPSIFPNINNQNATIIITGF
jgi:hypothetical protein